MEEWPAGALVRIRVASEDDQPFLDGLNRNRSHWNDSPRPRRTMKEKREQDALCGDNGGHFVIERLVDGAPVGDIVYKPVQYHPSVRAWAVGRELRPEARRKGYGTEAMALMVDWLFTNTDAYRIEGQNDVENAASQRSVEKVGWKREGVLRAALMRDGKYRDLYSYSILRPEWEARRRAASGETSAARTVAAET